MHSVCLREMEKRDAEKPFKIKKKGEMLSETEGGQSFSVLQDQISHLLRIHIDWHQQKTSMVDSISRPVGCMSKTIFH